MSIRTVMTSGATICLLVATGCSTSPQAKETKYLERGDALVAKKDFSRALLEYRNAAKALPKDAEPHYRMGLAYLESGDIRSAIRAFNDAIALNPKHTGAQLKLAEFMTASKDEKLIQAGASKLLEVFGSSPNNPEALVTMAVAEWKLGKPEEAVERLQETLKKFPAHLQSSVTLARLKLSKNDWVGAEAVLKTAVAEAPQSVPALLALSEFHIFRQQPGEAEVELKQVLQRDPKNGPALLALGGLQMAAKRVDEADQTYKRLAALPEKNYRSMHASFLFLSGRREAAVTEFEALVKADPNDRETRTRLLGAYFSLKRIVDAENLLASALKRNPKDTDALLQRAELRLQGGKTEQAEKDLEEVVHFNPDAAVPHFLRAEVSRIKGQVNNQEQELQEALRLDPGMLQARLALELSYLTTAQGKAALEIIDGAPEFQKSQVSWMIGRNWALLATGNLQDAKTGVDRTLQAGRIPVALYQNAVIRFLQRDYDGAIIQLEELLKSDTLDTGAARLLMEAYAAKRETSKGIAKLSAIAAAHPPSAQFQQLLGEWQSRNGNVAEAQKAYEAALAADRQFLPAQLSLAEMKIQEGRYDDARQKLGAIVSANATNVPALLLLARAEDAAGDRTAMIGRYRSVLAVDGTNVVALNNLAYSLALENPDEALKFAQQAVEKAPEEPSIQDTLGWIYYRKGLYSMSIRYLKAAVEKQPNPRRQFHLGMSYLKTGEQATGQKLVREALQKEPTLAKTEQGW